MPSLSEMVVVQTALEEVLDSIFSTYHSLVPEDSVLSDFYNYEILPYDTKNPTIKLYEGTWLIGCIKLDLSKGIDQWANQASYDKLECDIYEMIEKYVDESY